MQPAKILSIFVAIGLFNFLLIGSVFAQDQELAVADQTLEAEDTLDGDIDAQAQPEEYESCGFDVPEETHYGGEVVAVRRKLRIESGEAFRVKAFIKNTGNVPVFSGESVCFGGKLYLGTDKLRDRESVLYNADLQGWVSPNRVMMDQKRVNPGEIASFTFWSIAPERTDILKEYFTPVIEGLEWLEDAQFSFELAVGDAEMHTSEARKRLDYSIRSGSVMDIPIDGEKEIIVDVGAQMAYAKVGDYVVRSFPISSGAASTPTPISVNKIVFKQTVRIGSKAPYYIMPNFMWFREGGYGFHGLPSLGSNDLRSKIRNLLASGQTVPTSLYQDDAFWTEALDHIGRPVSHGCVRILPEDSIWLFDFAEIGTTVRVVRNVSADMLPEGYM